MRYRVRAGHFKRARRGAAAALMLCALVLAAAAPPAAAAPLTIVALGDSLTAGYNLPAAARFAARLEAALRSRGHDVVVRDAGVSGDTATAGLSRLDWAVGAEADAVIVELGANDALRGIDPAVTRKALERIIARLKERGLAVLLAGMRAPPNMGRHYERRFNAIYPALARAHEVVFYPFFLDGVAAEPGLNQDDGMHPNARGVEVIVARMLPHVERLIAAARAGDRAAR